MKIEIAISCVWFQRRLCWMLSSIAQQINAPELIVNIGYIPNNGNPITENVGNFFRHYFELKQVICSPEEIPYRGLVRNRQLANSKADWILFADSDMVYHPNFFENLAVILNGSLANETRCISASRISLDKDYCNDFFKSWDVNNGFLVPNVAETVSKFPINQGHGRGVGKNGVTRNVGAGYFQLANVENLRKNHQGLYWQPTNRRDPSWGYKSDRQFRQMVGGICPVEILPQYHLNHERDSDLGKHVEIQR